MRAWRVHAAVGLSRHIGMQDFTGRMFHDHKDVEEAKGRGDRNAEVTGDDCLGVIVDKRPPELR